jgi:hypothetical protein
MLALGAALTLTSVAGAMAPDPAPGEPFGGSALLAAGLATTRSASA